ncbi:NUDIX domain-containing protein [Candidatus Pacearchaeota archaeon]|nr:NUDIX domain-containing protein [Candidatus Pacearchaeota archaeon]
MRYDQSAGFIIFFNDVNNSRIKFLLLKYPNYWGFPKGMIEKDESSEQAAKRELEEETGIKEIKIIPGFRHEQEWFFQLNNERVKKKAVFFLAETTKEEAKNTRISWEHEDFAWLSLEDALKKLKIKQNKEMLLSADKFIVMGKQKKLF